jgi:hypothetical protein
MFSYFIGTRYGEREKEFDKTLIEKKKLYKLLINHMIVLCNMRFPTNALSTKASRKLKLNYNL